MAKHKKSKVWSGKRSRFSLTSRGEMALAVVGVIVVAVAVFFAWALLSPMIFKPDPAKVAAEKKLKAEADARWASLNADGTVLRVDERLGNLVVDGERWAALGTAGQDGTAKAIADHFGWSQCFFFDGTNGVQVGWYTRADGYKKVEPSKK